MNDLNILDRPYRDRQSIIVHDGQLRFQGKIDWRRVVKEGFGPSAGFGLLWGQNVVESILVQRRELRRIMQVWLQLRIKMQSSSSFPSDILARKWYTWGIR